MIHVSLLYERRPNHGLNVIQAQSNMIILIKQCRQKIVQLTEHWGGLFRNLPELDIRLGQIVKKIEHFTGCGEAILPK